jgi:soluble lytic murein transglycosylase
LNSDFAAALVAVGLALVLPLSDAWASEPRARSPERAPQQAELTPDQAFLAARRAFANRDIKAFETSARSARGHALEDYLDYWRVSLKLRAGSAVSEETDREAERTIARHRPGLPSELLRRDWLESLATRSQWGRFDTEYAQLQIAPEAGLRCLAALSSAHQGSVPAELIETLLMVPRELPEGCRRLFDHLLQSGRLGAPQAERRLLRALESGSKPAIRHAGPAVGIVSPELERALSGTADTAAAETGRLAALIEIGLLARADPARAAQVLGASRAALRPADRDFLWSQIAAAGMRRLLPESLEWTRKGLRAAASDDTFAWLARAALRAQDWALVASLIERMSPAGQQDPSWTYWRARALAERGQRAEADRLLNRIAGGFDFYGLLATEDLGRKPRLPDFPSRALDAAEIDAAGANRGLSRALQLHGLGLRWEGNREWTHALRGLSDRQLLAVATWACRRGAHDRCVNTAEMTRQEHDFRLRFITPFNDDVRRASAERGLDPAWVYGVIRQESRFITDARSSAGAQGLMQIMPATGRWIAGKLEQRSFRIEQLHEVRTNVQFGTFYLRNVLDDLGGSPVLASAGYNAGPRRPQQWRETLPAAVAGELFAEIIPFNETRDYVKKVLANATLYSKLFSGEPQSLRAWLGEIAPRQGLASSLP